MLPAWLYTLVCVLAGFLLYLAFDVLLEEIRWRRRGPWVKP